MQDLSTARLIVGYVLDVAPLLDDMADIEAAAFAYAFRSNIVVVVLEVGRISL